MKVRYEPLGPSAVFHAGVARLRKALLLLAFIGCTVVVYLYWAQPSIENEQVDISSPRTHYPTFDDLILSGSSTPQWTWVCKNNSCQRTQATLPEKPQSLMTCNMLCASTQLWPQPTGPVSLASKALPVRASGFTLQIEKSPSKEVSEHLNGAFSLFKDDLMKLKDTEVDDSRDSVVNNVTVYVAVDGNTDPRLRLNTDESYKLTLKHTNDTLIVKITARSFCGARHGFETLSQLVWLDPYAGTLLILEAASVEDAPKFKYRGLLLDTARNYFPVSDLLRTIDAMAANKLNTFHWHATDSQSFPLGLNSAPQLAQHGAYGPAAIYTPEDIRIVVNRAKLRGIRVVIEIDAPAHVGSGWTYESDGADPLAYCVEQQPWSTFCGEPPCGQLNPLNPRVFEMLERIYAEVIEMTGVDDVFHIGGDEVNANCWSKNIPRSNPKELWFNFTQQSIKALERANRGKIPEITMIWSSGLTQTPYLQRLDSNLLTVQLWGASQWPDQQAVLNAGFRSVISHVNAWYLDCGFGSWRDDSFGHCGEYRSWQQVYDHRPWKESHSNKWRIEGGAACLWTEELGPTDLDTRLWPRGAAIAERLWSDTNENATADVYLRIDTHRLRLLARGIGAVPIWPRWCTENPHICN